ncbi:MAG: cytosine deaminase [Merismopedia sp. SIO2A8]|nr:cytosine deaminase [Symploca sp. SIO2B6]NET48303.1 cytosine deaminase [Merismopedia sp. SIO2A8]
MIVSASHYWLKNAHVPHRLLSPNILANLGLNEVHGAYIHDETSGDGLVVMDIEINQGLIQSVQSSSQSPEHSTVEATPREDAELQSILALDLRHKQVWPGFVDMHTHLDKGHIWERTPNRDRTFAGALEACDRDMVHWTPEDLYQRMNFGLKCSYAHGTVALRTHLDAIRPIGHDSFEVFQTLQREWGDRLTLQAVCLTTLDSFLGAAGEALADLVACTPGGVLGGVAFPSDDMDTELDRVFAMAKERHLDLDFHVDESGNPHHNGLRHIARAALRHQFEGRITCGHCCSLAVQPPSEVRQTIAMVKEAGIGIVSLPLCNLYLQDREQSASANLMQMGLAVREQLATGRTPRWRGVTLLHELNEAGVEVAIANDNCRDPFHGFGDHDMLEVFNLSARIAHLDHPYFQWVKTVTSTPAQLMGLSNMGVIEVGQPANLVIFQARTFSELLSRPQGDRIVLRNGKEISTTLPSYEELDDLFF